MNTNHSSIKCPNCGTDVNIEEGIYSQMKSKFDGDIAIERKKYQQAMYDLNFQQEQLQEKEKHFEKKLSTELETKLSEAKLKLQESMTKDIKATLIAENSLQIKQLQDELSTKSKQVQELNESKAKIAKLQRDNQEIESKVKADSQIELNKLLDAQKLQSQKDAQELNDSKLKIKDEQLDQVRKQLDDALRKAEQGSQQIQGEAQEKSIESFLELTFKYDDVQEVKKGAFGADCIQTINTPDFNSCGKICYESKNTKTFSNDWIKKLKQDMLDAGADVGVLVTTVLPKEMDRMGFIDGVWVCNYDEFKGSAALIRDGVIGVYKASKSQENRADKTSLLYSYFTGKEFSMQLASIVEGFVQMQTELDKQRRSVMASWKRQQKYIDSVLINTTNMYGSIKGIAGNAIADIQTLELEHLDDEDIKDDDD